MIRRGLACVGVMLGSAAFTWGDEAPSTQPPQPVSIRWNEKGLGLAVAVYQTPTVQAKPRRIPPGVAPLYVGTMHSLNWRGGAELGGHDGMLQAEITGDLLIDAPGEYQFEADADDAMFVFLDGASLVNDRWINGTNPPTTAKATLTAGPHALRIVFLQGDGGINMRLRWKTPGASDWADIPESALRVGARPASDLATTGPTSQPSDRAYRSVFTSRGFGSLREEETDLLIELLEGPTELSKAARRDFSNFVEQSNYAKLPYWHQSKELAGFLRGWVWGQTHRGGTIHRVPFELQEAVAIQDYRGWRGAQRGDYFKSTIRIDSHEVTVFTPEADAPERQAVAEALAGLPPALRVLVKTVRVEPLGTASEFNGGGDEFWIRLKKHADTPMLDDVFAHEIGHVLMNHTDCFVEWSDAIEKDILSTSEYGRRNPSEDFAEFCRLYVGTDGDPAQLQSLRLLFPNRMPIMERLFAGLKQ
ncbi:MAG: PA14 domain-containing protein [Tepidisphaeraceae bacterium]